VVNFYKGTLKSYFFIFAYFFTNKTEKAPISSLFSSGESLYPYICTDLIGGVLSKKFVIPDYHISATLDA